jgi:hypothetical protein
MTITPIRKVDSTGAVRAKRYRERKRQHAVTARHATVTLAVMLAALASASVSAGFAITGLTTIFRGAFWPVVGMGIALEAGKLSAVAWLGRGVTAPLAIKGAIVALVIVLMTLNAVGAHGFLTNAHLTHAVAGKLTVDGHAAEIDARMNVAASTLADVDRRIGQIDNAIAEATRRGRTSAAMALVDRERRNRAELVSARLGAANALAAMQIEAAAVQGERTELAADSGPVRYLAGLIGAADDAAMKFFILAVACMLDPLAVALLLAATIGSRTVSTP